MQNRSDQQLITDYFKGDEESFEILVKRYLRSIYSFVYRYAGNPHDAEDITQTVFVKVWRNLKKFNPRKSRFATLRDRQRKSPAPYRTNEVSSDTGFKTWIFRIARNTSIDWLKKKRHIAFSAFETEEGGNALAETLVDPSPLPDELAERENISEMLSGAMEKLSFNYCLVLILHYQHSYTFREIAEILKESIDTVKTRHRRAIAALRKLLQDK